MAPLVLVPPKGSWVSWVGETRVPSCYLMLPVAWSSDLSGVPMALSLDHRHGQAWTGHARERFLTLNTSQDECQPHFRLETLTQGRKQLRPF